MILIGGKKQFKANLHSHSNLSDGKLSPEKLKEIYKKNGYSVLAITDHEYPFDHSALTDEDFVMLTGYEAYIRPSPTATYDIYSPEIHINLFAKDAHNVSYVNYVPMYCKYIKDPEYRESLPKIAPGEAREYTVEYVNSFIENAKSAGYICAYNHPVWSLEEQDAILKYRGFFSMEMCNWGAHLASRIEYNGALYNMLLREGVRIFCHGSDDNHNFHPLSSPRSDSFGAFTVISAEKLDYDSVIRALETGDFYSSMGPLIEELIIDGECAKIKTSKAMQIMMHSGSKKVKYEIAPEGQTITEASFEIPKEAPYVRFSVLDYNGKYADTRGYFRDELGI